MNKILVTIYVLTLNEEFDVFLPIGLNTKEAIDYIQDSLCELSNNNYIKQDNVNLYTANGLVINQNNIVKFSGLKNGIKVLLY